MGIVIGLESRLVLILLGCLFRLRSFILWMVVWILGVRGLL